MLLRTRNDEYTVDCREIYQISINEKLWYGLCSNMDIEYGNSLYHNKLFNI